MLNNLKIQQVICDQNKDKEKIWNTAYFLEQNMKQMVFEIDEIERYIEKKTLRLVDLKSEYNRASEQYYREMGEYTTIVPYSEKEKPMGSVEGEKK